jgi:hypothetical protein
MADKTPGSATSAPPIADRAPPLRTFRIPALARENGSATLEVDGRTVYCVQVEQGHATLITTVAGPVRIVTTFDSQETLDGVVAGRIHPIVAALQNRLTTRSGDRRFGLSVLLALRASAPAFAKQGD